MPLYEFRCANGHETERIRPLLNEWIICPECGDSADRVAGVYRVAQVQPEADSRGMFRRYSEATAELDDKATRIETNEGVAVKTPNYWKQAQARADAMTAAGEAFRPVGRD